MTVADKTLECRECKKAFTFTAGEQEFYATHSLNEPRHCPECRAIRRKERQQDHHQDSPRPSFPATCAACGVETTLPFEPSAGRPVYCRDCYTKMKQSAKTSPTSN